MMHRVVVWQEPKEPEITFEGLPGLGAWIEFSVGGVILRGTVQMQTGRIMSYEDGPIFKRTRHPFVCYELLVAIDGEQSHQVTVFPHQIRREVPMDEALRERSWS